MLSHVQFDDIFFIKLRKFRGRKLFQNLIKEVEKNICLAQSGENAKSNRVSSQII